MKYLVFLALPLFAHDLHITFKNLNSEYPLFVGVYTNGKDFLQKESYGYIFKPKSKQTLRGIEHDEVAIALFQDKNGNKKLDKLFFIPTEPYGFSNNPRTLFRPATFEEAKIDLNQTNNISITLK